MVRWLNIVLRDDIVYSSLILALCCRIWLLLTKLDLTIELLIAHLDWGFLGLLRLISPPKLESRIAAWVLVRLDVCAIILLVLHFSFFFWSWKRERFKNQLANKFVWNFLEIDICKFLSFFFRWQGMLFFFFLKIKQQKKKNLCEFEIIRFQAIVWD